ncbi:Hypothetical protein NTJ_01094 [Nesidiocoris tenuis]|uniref:Uncharacterized protein n=1 Tax=Nesidiocoris tenuis TaxID=355587 RepID=A0ABN7A7N4_9HEMI|nr:Hypothetical protein NTJ_01094 [Nesidiocoris tenuis]
MAIPSKGILTSYGGHTFCPSKFPSPGEKTQKTQTLHQPPQNQKNRSFRTSCVFVLMLRLHQPHRRRLDKTKSRLDLRHRGFLYADQAGFVVHHD